MILRRLPLSNISMWIIIIKLFVICNGSQKNGCVRKEKIMNDVYSELYVARFICIEETGNVHKSSVLIVRNDI